MPEFKFGRSFVLRIEGNLEVDGAMYTEITSPFTCEFNIVRNLSASTNIATFVIYNLSPDVRSKIYKDPQDVNNLKAIQFFAGYSDKAGDMLPRCFKGTVRFAYSQRNGPDFRTIIEAYDGFNSAGITNLALSIPANTNAVDTIKAVTNQITQQIKETLPSVGKLGVTISKKSEEKMTKVASRATAMMGTPEALMNQVTGGDGYIDGMAFYSLTETDVLEGDVRLIDTYNGLLGTPRKADTYVEIDMLFEPRIKPAQLIELSSETDDRYNGVHRVSAITHKGVISGSQSGDCITSLSMLHLKGYEVVLDEASNEYMVQNI